MGGNFLEGAGTAVTEILTEFSKNFNLENILNVKSRRPFEYKIVSISLLYCFDDYALTLSYML